MSKRGRKSATMERTIALEWVAVGEDAKRQLQLAACFLHRAISILYTLMRRLHLALQVVALTYDHEMNSASAPVSHRAGGRWSWTLQCCAEG